MNVTAPFKNSMLQILDKIDSLSKQVGGVNCVYFENDLLCGFNSDLFGVSDSFKNRGIDLAGKSVLIIGAGGATQAAVCALTNEKSKICIVNRTIERAKVLAEKYNCNYAGLEDLPKLLKSNSIVISTLASEHNVVKPEWMHSDLTVFDADYKQAVVAEMAEKAGCMVIRGEEWLLNQAIPAYRRFVGQNPDLSLMRQALNSTQALNKSRIILTGFMASGKTTVGKILAQKLGWQFLDTDQLIEAKMQKTITEIFEIYGETEFRRIESEILQEVAKIEKTVIASGGGIVLSEENRLLLKKEFLPIWLFAKPETVLLRINKDNQNRPLLNCANPLTKAKDLLNQRKNYYALSCELIVNTETRTPEQVAGKIYDEFRRIL
jgi:shikimate dehydrogenase